MRLSRAAIAVALCAAACGDGSPTPPSNNNNNGGNPPPSTCTSTSVAVTVSNNAFTPQCTRVTAGSTVTWTWAEGSLSHNVTFQSGSNSATQSSGTFERAFPNTGTFPYQCTLHAGMTGEVRVE